MTYFQKKFRFPFLAPYLYASSRFVADLIKNLFPILLSGFSKKFIFLLSLHIGNENSSLLTKSEIFQLH